ncbi:hypothetical protein KKF61_05505 [Patescibacteria group bacterium]|nr:hypothetical protein [Patescibacteria group bacterium]MBU0963523.1 hypothetical protein [Patescibacteria group bacterium]
MIACLTPQAEAQLGWFAAGYLLGSGDNTVASGSGDLLYKISRIDERIKDPLDVRTTCLRINYYDQGKIYKGMTLREIFTKVLEKSGIESGEVGEYILLRMSRAVDFSPGDKAVYWIEYIEKSKVLPDDQLLDPEP